MIEDRLAKGSKILDVGCGTGHLAAELARRGYDTWGTDLSAGMVDYARANYNQDRYQVGDIEKIPFPTILSMASCASAWWSTSPATAGANRDSSCAQAGRLRGHHHSQQHLSFFYLDRVLVRTRFAIRPATSVVRSLFGGKPRPAQTLPKVNIAAIAAAVGEAPALSPARTRGLGCHAWGCYAVERFFPQGGFCRASDQFARNRAVNWLASDQLVRVRAVK